MASTSNVHQPQAATSSRFTSIEDIPPAYVPAKFRRAIIKLMVKNLPADVRNRVIALKNLQLDCLEMEAEYWTELNKLEAKYHLKMQPLMDKRKKIVAGEIDPPLEAPKWPIQKENCETGQNGENYEYLQYLELFQPFLEKFKQLPKNFKGIPNFWAIIFRNCGSLSVMVSQHDEPVLQKLLDVKVNYEADSSFTLEFLFDKNEYFTNSVLTKKYFVTLKIDESDPFNFDGPVIYKCQGCKIDWKVGKNLTMMTIEKEVNSGGVNVGTEAEQVRIPSFFNFFDPPVIPEDAIAVDWVTRQILDHDFKLGNTLRESIIPKAILFYSGDILPDEEEEEYDDDEFSIEEAEQYGAEMNWKSKANQNPTN